MVNYVQEGDTLTLTAPYDVVAGAGALVGIVFGVSSYDVLSGALYLLFCSWCLMHGWLKLEPRL